MPPSPPRVLQEGFQAEDDVGAHEEYEREVDEEEAFRKARDEAMAANVRAQAASGGQATSSAGAQGWL